MNYVAITGNLTKDVELRPLQNDKSVGNFSIAVNEKYKDTETVSYFDITVWNKQAENCEKYLGKGSKVLIEGSLKQESWETLSGDKRTAVKITAHRVEFIGKPKDSAALPDTTPDPNVPF